MQSITFLSVLILLAAASVSGILLKYILDLEKKENCECSQNNKKEFIKYFLMTSLAFSFISLLRILLGFKITNVFYRLFVSLFQLAALVNVVVMFLYTRELKQKDCKCSEDWKRVFMSRYSTFFVVIYPLLILFLVIANVLRN